MTEPDQTTETRPVGEGEPQVAETPDAPEESRETAGNEPDYKRLYLDSKTKIEEANRVLREREAGEQSPAAPTAQPTANVDWSRVQYLADNGDETSKGMLLMRDFAVRMEIDSQLKDIPEPDRDTTRQLWLGNPQRFGDAKAAYSDIREKKLATENEELRKKLDLASRKPDPEVQNAVATAGRSNTTATTTKEYTEEQFDAEHERIMQSQGELAALKFAATAPGKWKR